MAKKSRRTIPGIVQTANASQARWPGTVEERKKERTEQIILTIARLGWANVELINYILCMSSQTWAAELDGRGLLFRQKVVIAEQTKSRTKASTTVMTILLLSDAGQRLARSLDDRIGKRVRMPSLSQVRHDLIAFWAAAFAMRERMDLVSISDQLEIWGDQVMRMFLKDDIHRPDASIYFNERRAARRLNSGGYEAQPREIIARRPIVHIEVERSKKKSGLEEYLFIRKLKAYTSKGVEVILVTETQGRAVALRALLMRSDTEGIEGFFQNEYNDTWHSEGRRVRIAGVEALVVVWDHEKKAFVEEGFGAYPHNWIPTVVERPTWDSWGCYYGGWDANC